MEDLNRYHCYFKRSLLPEDFRGNVHPLNLMVNFSYKPFKMLAKIGPAGSLHLIRKKQVSEIVRILDVTAKKTNLSHHAMDIRHFPTSVADNGGKILYLSRLWDPARHTNPEEKERRRIQSETRIAICRTIRRHFPGSIVGLANEPYTQVMAPDLVLDNSFTSKLAFMKALRSTDICLADDGLGDTPGWKIGEYLMHGKAIITTPIRTVVQDFKQGRNYLELEKNRVENDLLDLINQLLSNKRYTAMGNENLAWSQRYLYPDNYLKNLLHLAGEMP